MPDSNQDTKKKEDENDDKDDENTIQQQLRQQQRQFDDNRLDILSQKEKLHILNKKIKDEKLTLKELEGAVDTVKRTVRKQNNSLDENLRYLQNKNSADQQKIHYQQLQTEYLIILNFYLLYLFMALALVWGYFWFFVRKTNMTIYSKWFWYLHVFFYPYLAIYFEFVTYLLIRYVISLINGNPFYPWNNYTSYPPIV